MNSATPLELTPEQRQTLESLAAQLGKPCSEVLDEALDALQKSSSPARATREETVFDALVRLGLLGCIKDGPADLSTNPDYMQGFGSP